MQGSLPLWIWLVVAGGILGLLVLVLAAVLVWAFSRRRLRHKPAVIDDQMQTDISLGIQYRSVGPVLAPGAPVKLASVSPHPVQRPLGDAAANAEPAHQVPQNAVTAAEPSAERALFHSFDPVSGAWTKSETTICMHAVPFASGAQRAAYLFRDTVTGQNWVAKFSLKEADEQVYFADVETQAVARLWADSFNATNPPKRIDFLPAYVMQLPQREKHKQQQTNTAKDPAAEQRVLCGAEPFLPGFYQKHNNNYGSVSTDRFTPQAFSHYTLERSKGQLVVVDIQGVEDFYTDPQIHSRSGNGFGKGNLGQEGIEKFCSTHVCNPVCLFLNLHPLRPGAFSVQPPMVWHFPPPPPPPPVAVFPAPLQPGFRYL